MTELNDLRITLVWTETYLDHLQSATPEERPFGFLGHGYAYKARVAPILTGKTDPAGLTLPWRNPAGNRFWSYYLGRVPGSATSRDAWEALLPLRGPVPVKATPSWASTGMRVYAEGYFYPFGHAVAITVRLRGNFSLEQAVQQAHQAVRHGVYTITPEGQTPLTGNLNQLAEVCLRAMRQNSLGSSPAGGFVLPQPFSIVTVIRGKDVDPTVPLPGAPESSTIQRTLEALSGWQDNWQTVNLPPLTEKNVSLDKARQESSPGDVLYGSKRGRTVWYPGRFTLNAPTSALSCYHRNLVIATMHTEMMARFCGQIQSTYPTGDYRFQPNLRGCAKQAADTLGRLHAGDASTYRSGSVKTQIDQESSKNAINALRADFKFPTI